MNELLVLVTFAMAFVAAMFVFLTIIKSLQDQINRQDDQLRNIRYGYVHGQEFSDLKEEVRQLENHLGVVIQDRPSGKEVQKIK